LRSLLSAWAIPTIVVTHDPADVQSLADEVVVLNEGRILQQGPVADVFANPASPEVARILAIRSDRESSTDVSTRIDEPRP
jgi:ABC-type sulfate/molybdate transport systems ATPase subunit